MSDSSKDQPQQEAPAKRGEAAWKQAKEAVGERNEKARKAARQQRQADERRSAERRRAADLREVAELSSSWNSTGRS